MKKIFVIILLLVGFGLYAQEQNPPSLKWKSIESEHFEVVFPQEIETKAQSVINKLEHMYEPDSKILGSHPKKISLVLFNQSSTANAYARLAPRMMGWYVTPYNSVNLGITDWTTTLSIHEFKHVTQYSKLNSHFTRLGSILFGQMGQATLSFFSTPTWFMEGDAVYAETIYSNSGRGRVSNFSMPIRTILLSDEKISYNKAAVRSYKTYYPNHYYLGYYMVTHVNRNYGEDSWDKILNRTTYYSYWPFSFSRSIKKHTGYKVKRTYKNAMQELDSIYREQIKDVKFTEVDIINQKRKRSWTNYYSPEFIDNQSFYVLKSGFEENSTLYKIDLEGNEKRIREIDAQNISYANGKIVWEQINNDIRWGERSFREIMVYNTETKKLTQLTKKGKFFASDISPDGKKIVAIEFNSHAECWLHILDSETGEVIDIKASINGDYIRNPQFSEDGTKVVFSHNSDYGEGISYYDLETKEYVKIIPNDWELKSKPIFYENFIIFNSDYSGTGNIYAIDINTKERFQIVARKFGAYDAKVSPDNKFILFKDYNIDGYDIAKIPLNQADWTEIETVKVFKEDYFLTEQNKDSIKSIVSPEDIVNKKYEVKKYNKLKNSINIHSWSLLPSDTYLDDIQATVYSANKLNTLIFASGVNFNTLTNSTYGFFETSYQKYFPIFDASLMYGNRTERLSADVNNKTTRSWLETNFNGGVTLPFDFSKGIYYSNLSIGATGNYTFIDGKQTENGSLTLENGDFASAHYFVNYYRKKRFSWKDINTRFGQSIYLSYRHIPLSNNYEGQRIHASGKLYFPGILKHHNFVISAAYEQQLDYSEKNIYLFASNNNFTRGYEPILLDKIANISVDYQAPLFYPDFGVLGLIYFKRVRMNAFYDYGIGEYKGNGHEFASSGIELLVDFHLLRLPVEFNVGLQTAYLINNKETVFFPMIMGVVPF